MFRRMHVSEKYQKKLKNNISQMNDIVKSAGSSTLWTDFKYFKKEFIRNYA